MFFLKYRKNIKRSFT